MVQNSITTTQQGIQSADSIQSMPYGLIEMY